MGTFLIPSLYGFGNLDYKGILTNNQTTRQNVRPARHLYLVPELDPTPVGAYRPASRPGTRPAVRPAARRSAQHPSMSSAPSVATYQRRRLVVLVAAMLMFGVCGLCEHLFAEQVFDSGGEHPYDGAMTSLPEST